MKKLFSISSMLFVISSVYLLATFGQNTATLSLPEGAKARLGKGMVYNNHARRKAEIRDTVYNNLAYSPDGTRLAVAGSIGIWIYDARTGIALNLLAGDENFVFSPDGQTLASNSGGTTIRLWDMDTGKHLHTLTVHEDSVNNMSGDEDWFNNMLFSPDGQTLASTGGVWNDRTIRLWDVNTGKHLHTLIRHTYGVSSMSFSPDGQTLASGSKDETIRLWDVDTGEQLRTFKAHENSVNSVAFSPDGQTLASVGGYDTNLPSSGIRDSTTIRLWDPATGKQLYTLTGHEGWVRSVAFSPNGQTLVSDSTEDETIHLWDVNTGQQIRTLTGHRGRVISVSLSPDGHTLASSSWNGTIRLWDIDTGQQIHVLTEHENGVNSVSFSPDGRTLASGSMDNTIRLWNVNTGQQLRILIGHTLRVTSVSFGPDGQTLASSSVKDIFQSPGMHIMSRPVTTYLWNINTGKQLRALTGHWTPVNVSLSPDGRTLMSEGRGDTIHLWDVNTGQQIRTLTGYEDNVTSVSLGPDGRTLASGNWNGTIRLWDIDTGKELRTFTGHTSMVDSVSFSPDGRTLASTCSYNPEGRRDLWDKTIRLWDVNTGKELHILTGHTSMVNSVAFSPDGKTLASSNWHDSTIRLWDVNTGQQFRTLTGHESGVNSVSFSPDGQTLVSGSEDGTIRLWDIDTGQHLHTFTGHEDSISSVAFSPDGQTLASGSEDGTVLLWKNVK